MDRSSPTTKLPLPRGETKFTFAIEPHNSQDLPIICMIKQTMIQSNDSEWVFWVTATSMVDPCTIRA